MSIETPTTEPTSFVAGDTAEWNREDLSDYLPSDGWSLSYSLRGPANITIQATGTTEDIYEIEVTAATSASYKAGLYWWSAFVSKGTGASLERHQIGSGTLTVKPDLSVAEAGAYDGRSRAEQILDALLDAFLSLSSKGFSQITAGGRTWTKEKLPDLIAAIHEAERMVDDERVIARKAQGRGTGRKILMRFTR